MALFLDAGLFYGGFAKGKVVKKFKIEYSDNGWRFGWSIAI